MKSVISLILSAFFAVFSIGCENLPQPSVKIIAFGDSSTIEYPDYLPQYLLIPEKEIANRAVGGETTEEGLKRLNDLIVYRTFPNGQALLYWEGGNDLIDLITQLDPLLLFSPYDPNYFMKEQLDLEINKIKTNITQIIQKAKSQGWNVFIGTYPDLMPINCPAMPIKILLPAQAQIANEYQQILNNAIQEIALLNGATIVNIDNYEFLITQYKNCNHLNTEGNQIVAQEWAETLLNKGF